MKRRKGSTHYIDVFTLLGYPACAFTAVVSIGIFNIPTPALYA